MRLESDAEAIRMAADGLKKEEEKEKQEEEEEEKEKEKEEEEKEERESGSSRPRNVTMSSLLGSFQSKAGSGPGSLR